MALSIVRTPTAAQWASAWQRAVADGLDLFVTPDPHTFVVTSGTDAGRAYIVTDHRDLPGSTNFMCNCDGYATHSVCKHCAVVAAAVDHDGPAAA